MAAANWGFQNITDGQNPPNVLMSAAQQKTDCENFLYDISSYLPFGYIRDRICKASTSIENVFEHIFSYYGCLISQDTTPDFMSLQQTKEESYLQFFYRLLYHQRLHLMTNQCTVDDATVPAVGDRFTVSHMNLICMVWLSKINKDLLDKVRVEYGLRLKRGEALAGMVEEIANVIPTLLKDTKKEAAREDSLGVNKAHLSSKQQPENN